MIANAVSHTKGTGGSSHLDVDQFRHILLSKKFKTEVKELRKQPAAIARTLALTIVDLKSIKALTNCRLIPFNKNSSVRPIGIGKVFRKFIGKAINWILKDNTAVSRTVPNSEWFESWNRCCNHSMQFFFKDSSTEAVILVDLNNAFSNINRKVALHNHLSKSL